ncbi:hypothetical protein HY950_00175 [Candidatus Gottesmanbacteria bacterium]|nr:hypothetical protein [Candidatus Gottesmanbacteria bacterium]
MDRLYQLATKNPLKGGEILLDPPYLTVRLTPDRIGARLTERLSADFGRPQQSNGDRKTREKIIKDPISTPDSS